MRDRRRGWAAVGAVLLALGLTACGRESGGGAAGTAQGPVTVLAGSELRDVEPQLLKAAADAGVPVKLSYAGTLDIVERVNAGEAVDMILPPSGAYPSLALATPPRAREKLFYSRVVLGVRSDKARALGWDRRAPAWTDIARAAGAGQLHFAMTNPTSSNTGMSALFAVASAVAGKTEDLSEKEVNGTVLKAFLAGQTLTAGSSGWLAEAYARDPSALDAMINYEAVILRTNASLADKDRLVIIHPRDGVITADYPLMLLNERRRDAYTRLVAAFKSVAVQQNLAASAFLRPALPDVPLAAGVSPEPVVELTFPNRLEVIDAVLQAAQAQWRRPATSIFVLDVSDSMAGARLDAMRQALLTLVEAKGLAASQRYAGFQPRERVIMIPFSDKVFPPTQVDFGQETLDDGRRQLRTFVNALHIAGGTAIYAALIRADELADAELRQSPDRTVSIVLLTDGINNSGPGYYEFMRHRGADAVRVFPILFGEASVDQMESLASATRGRTFDGRHTALASIFKDIRAYQ
ncbi:MAG TPA: substrate-binding domain-containing protein [Rhodocyclaceae bacterium]|nr:substrate-binding domain-containing protein [Rhodocyclaceae bacterium]